MSYGPLYTEGSLAYHDATWETAVKQNLGIEMTLFRKLTASIDLFKEDRTGILMSRNSSAPWMGAGLPSVNIGKTKNHGLELELGWNDKVGKDFPILPNLISLPVKTGLFLKMIQIVWMIT